jgi:hypothetical protein
MRIRRPVFLTALVLASATLAIGQAAAPLKLEQTIELPDVQGRIDHMSIDIAGQRLFVSALGNNTVEVVDLKAGKRAHTISGLKEQGRNGESVRRNLVSASQDRRVRRRRR